MDDAKDMLIADAIETAIKAERKVILQSRIIKMLSVICAVLGTVVLCQTLN